MVKPGRLRILQIANQAGPLYLFMPPLCRALREAGAEIEFACMPVGALWEPLKKSENSVHALDAGNWSNPVTWVKIYRSVRSLLRSGNFDLMIVHTPAMSWIARFAARDLVGASIYFAHGLPFAPLQSKLTHVVFRGIEQYMSRYTDAVFVVNNDDSLACRNYKLTKKKDSFYHVPGPGVDVCAFCKKPSEEEIKNLDREISLQEGKPMVLFLGRFIATKRPGDILKLAKMIGPDAEFVLAGEGPLWEKIRRSAIDIGPHVKVIKFTDKVKLLFSRCSVFVLPSVFREGLPQTLLETHAAGKPAVAYNVRGSRDIIEDGKTGYLVEPFDIEGLYSAVNRILKDNDLRDSMGRAARERAYEKFSIESALGVILPSINEVLTRKGINVLSLVI